MPEICGIISAETLCNEKINGIEYMRNALRITNLSQAESIDLSWGAISVITHHRNDTGQIKYDKENRCCYGYLGNEQNLPLKINHQLDNTNSRYIDKYLTNCIPPFFCFIVNKRTKYNVKLVSDQFGLIPVYYSYQNGDLIFCTKLDPLLKSGLVKWKLDKKAIFDFFTYEHVTGDNTFADAVSVLSPGNILTFNAGILNVRKYFDLFEDRTYKKIDSIDIVSDKLFELLTNSVESAIKNNSVVAVNLSGGFDSRALLGCALKNRTDLIAYTFGIHDSDDIKYAKKIANECSIKHQIITTSGDFLHRWFEHGIFVTSGMVSCNHYHILQLAKLLHNEADAVLDGFAGDALTGGHLTSGMLNARSKDKLLNALRVQRATAFNTPSSLKEIFHPDYLDSDGYDPLNSIRPYFNTSSDFPLWYGCHLFDLYERQRRFIQYGAHQLRPFVNVKIPFLSIDIVNFLISLDAKLLSSQACYRHMHIKHLSLLAKIPDTARGVPIAWPQSVRYAKYLYRGVCRKLPKNLRSIFLKYRETVSYGEWYRTILRSFVEDNLLGIDKVYEGIIQKGTVETILKEHMSGQRDHHIKIGCLLTFAHWYRRMDTFIDK
jgi:asparagine synthetase B (glutamine-hydrolysing)